jgi:hypothetical protein
MTPTAGTKRPKPVPPVTPSRLDSLIPCDTEETVPPVIDWTTQHQGNRVTRRFYPEHYAKVQYARWVQNRYGRVE